MLDNHPRHQLRFIIDNYGRSIIDDPRRCRGMLKDLAPKHQRETNLLMLALDQKLVAELTQKTHTPILMHLDILAQRLHNNVGIQKDYAVWAIESWALALDVIQQPSAQQIITPEPEPEPAPMPIIVKPEPQIIVPPKPAPIISKPTPIITTLPPQSPSLHQNTFYKKKLRPIISVIIIVAIGLFAVSFFSNTIKKSEIFSKNRVTPLTSSTTHVDSSKPQQIGKFIVQDGVATDTKTGFMWLRFAYGQHWENGTVAGDAKALNWNNAMDIPQEFNQQGYAGYNDWRVPNIDELRTLVDKVKGKEGNYIDTDVFPKSDLWFWSSSTNTDSSNYAWYVSFYGGYSVNYFKSSYGYVRLVRLVRG